MTAGLHVIGGGAVTPVGLDALQTCAGVRARMARFEEVLRRVPFGKPQVVARIPAHWSLRRTPTQWLVNLAARAVTEIVTRHSVDPERTALVVIPPERFRQASFIDTGTMINLAKSIAGKTGARFESVSQIPEGGAASLAKALALAGRCLSSRDATHVILGGVDSYVLDAEYQRLDIAGRLRTEGKAQGLTPGEAAAFVLLTNQHVDDAGTSLAILACAEAVEPLSATSTQYSQGRGMVTALRAAISQAETEEADLEWVISNGNGERYASWEAILGRARFYRARRERLPTTYPALSVGETGAASSALALLVALHGFSRGYCPGRNAMIELSSEGDGRAACVVAASGNVTPR